MLKNAIALLVGAILSLLILEIGLRIFDPFKFSLQGDRIKLHRNVLNYNNQGFKGPELNKESNNKKVKILTVGGSTTAADNKKFTDSWAGQFFANLDSNKVWLNNAGYSGHSTKAHIILIEDFLLDLHPDWLIFLVGINDFARDNIHYHELEGISLSKQGRSYSKYNLLGKIKFWLIDHIKVASDLRNLLRSWEAHQAGLTDSEFVVTEFDYAKTDSTTREKILSNIQTSLVQEYRYRLTEILELCQQNEIDVVLITQPLLYGNAVDSPTGIDLGTLRLNNSSQPHSNKGLNVFRIDSHLPEIDSYTYWCALELYNEVTRSLANKYNLVLIDMAKLFPKSSDYFSDSMHYTLKGESLFGSILYNELIKKEKFLETLN